MFNNPEIHENIQFLAKSEIRLKILSELQEKPKSIAELVKSTQITYSSVSCNISKLEKNKHVKKIRSKYHINPLTLFYFKTLMDFKTSIKLTHDFNDLWDKHNINQLSLDAVRNINDLENATLIETTPIDIYKTHKIIKKNIIQSKNLKAVFPYLHPEYPKLIEHILKKNGRVELILPKYIFKETVFKIDESIRRNAARNGNLKVYAVKNDLRLYLTICDETMSLGLFKDDDSFDQNRILISDEHQSKEWAEDLFEHIKTKV